MLIPRTLRRREQLAKRLVEECSVSRGQREQAYRNYGQWIERGWSSEDGQGGMALANVLYSHNDRLAAYLFSPVDLRFGIDFENHYLADTIEKGATVAKLITREWERKSLDMLWGSGVRLAVDYGACLFKQLVGRDAEGCPQLMGARLVPPWMFGVLNEGVNDLENQEAFVETMMLNKYEVWRRIRHLPDAEKLYRKILASSNKDTGAGVPSSYMHQVLSTTVLDLSPQSAGQTKPGGWVQTGTGSNYPVTGPQVYGDLYPMYEIWVWDDEASDYTTMVFMEPDILISPRGRPANLCVEHYHPYRLIQANTEPGYFWGRSEIVDLMRLQGWLTQHCSDINNIMGKQFDQLFAFAGVNGITTEAYMEFKSTGYIDLGPQGQANNVTPKMPENAIPLVREILFLMDRISGFPAIMSGSGEQGVRSGVHADTLMKTGSPRLRDRSLLIERQCAVAADTTLAIMQAKDATIYWTDFRNEQSDFLLSSLPEDRRVVVDSHSSSPIFQDDHLQMIAWGVKSGILDPVTAIEMLPFNNKDIILERLKAREQQKQEILARLEREDPEAYARAISGHPGHRRAA